MPSLKKIQIVNSLVEKIKQSPNFILIHFENIPHQKLEQLRQILRPATSSFQVVKNSLLKVAVQKINKKEIASEEVLTGTSALLTLPADWTTALSTFWKFAKTEGRLSFKIGVIDNQIYQKDDLTKLAQLPSKEELMGKVVFLIKSPLARIVQGLKSSPERMIRVLKFKSLKVYKG